VIATAAAIAIAAETKVPSFDRAQLDLECGVSMSPCTILCLYFESKDEWVVHCSAPKWVVSALKPSRIVVILSSATTKNIPGIKRQRGVLWWCSWNTVLGRSKT
jgi:hypothetical protein